MTDAPPSHPHLSPSTRPSNVTVHPATNRPGPSAPAPRATDPKAVAKARQREKTRAKNAMVASLGALVFTGYLCARGSRRDTESARMAHMVAGVALLGASYWHTTLYGARNGGGGGRV
ncbi:hypothetical protein [Rhodospira trueperi]|uniref:Uncharacterized protein n=1 Tax=Rhodospira trueperi TaxID=69960 RepID=A0A1G7GDU7_9PROT|nr:hypothetical protein [Rhodospira trueperi]SDE86312.1 hypothetical protein SAMN05421720_11454 [Rhodospira trueperi]